MNLLRGSKTKNEHGVSALLITLLLPLLLGFVALTIDLGYLYVVRNELQNMADAAALAATRELGHIYEGMSYQDQKTYDATSDSGRIKQAAIDVAKKNYAGGKTGENITIRDTGTNDLTNDLTIGQWNKKDETGNVIPGLTPTLEQPDAVRVIARRDNVANGPITTFFAKIFGRNTASPKTKATAALTGQSTAGPGGLPVPLGISRAWFDFNSCNQPIRFYPTNDPTSCAGWHVYNRYSNAPDSRLRSTINDLEGGSYESPETIANETSFEFTNGTMSVQTFEAMKALFDSRRVLNDGIIDSDENDLTWTTAVPVYGLDDCASMAGSQLIVGFATIVITGVQDSPTHQIDGYVICDNVEPGRGSGGDFGTKGSIPGLVDYPTPPS